MVGLCVSSGYPPVPAMLVLEVVERGGGGDERRHWGWERRCRARRVTRVEWIVEVAFMAFERRVGVGLGPEKRWSRRG